MQARIQGREDEETDNIVERIWRRKNKETHKEREEDKSKEEHRNA